MKFCVSIRQSDEILQQADEIFVEGRDIKGIYNFVEREEFKDKTFILQIPYNELYDEELNEYMDWEEIHMLSEKVNLICALENFRPHAALCRTYNLKYYWNYPLTSYYELEGAISSGVCYVKLGAPLYFELDKVARRKVPIRLTANVCYDNLFFHDNGITGTYIRPEDVKLYEEYVDAIEFTAQNLRAEAALFDTYKQGIWPGNLNILLTNFGYNVDNRGIPEEFGRIRMTCRQHCKINPGSCHFCESAIRFVQTLDKHKNDPDLLKQINAQKEQT